MGARTQAGGGRIALFDNLKGMLIILVVVGHVMHPVHSENPALSTLFDLIYLFHMPLFVLLSGLFAKGAWRPAADGGHGRLNVNRIISFVVLGLAYQVALLAVNGVLLEQPGRILLFSSAPWYLIAMAWWYLMTPALAKLGPARGMAVALAASLAWGCVDMSRGFLALSRTFAFLPCFALGYYLTTERLMRLRQRPILWLAVAAAALIMLARIVDEHAYDAFFPLVYGDNPYDDLELLTIAETMPAALAEPLSGAMQKLLTLGLAGVCSLAALKLAPKRRFWLTTLGERTLQVYVLHRIIRAWLTFHTPFYSWPLLLEPVPGLLIILGLSAAITAVTALPVFSRPFSRFLAIRWLPERRGETEYRS